MLVEGVGKVTFVNGILRLETMQINAGGELEGNGCIEIPGNRVGPVIDLIANATKQISEKLPFAFKCMKCFLIHLSPFLDLLDITESTA